MAAMAIFFCVSHIDEEFQGLGLASAAYTGHMQKAVVRVDGASETQP